MEYGVRSSLLPLEPNPGRPLAELKTKDVENDKNSWNLAKCLPVYIKHAS
jgi:hypothetical protein